MTYPIGPREKERVELLRKLKILDTAEEVSFDRLTEMTKLIFETPMVLVSLVDRDRQWFKSHPGLNACSTERGVAFCNYTVLGDAIFEVPDASQDARFKDNPLVTGEMHLRYYCGAPIIIEGLSIGSFCLLDTEPHPPMSSKNREILTKIAATVAREIEVRHLLKQSAAELITALSAMDQASGL